MPPLSEAARSYRAESTATRQVGSFGHRPADIASGSSVTIELGGHVDVRHERTDYEVDSIAKIPDGDISLQWVMFDDGQTIDDEFLSRLRLLDSLWGVDLLS